MRTAFASLVALLVGSGCGTSVPPVPMVDASRDANGGGMDATADAGDPDAAQPDGDVVDAGGVDAGDDGGGDMDAGPPPDTGPPFDSGPLPTPDTGTGGTVDGCVAPVCPPPPSGCSYVEATPCTCGRLMCPMGCGSGCSTSEYCEHGSAACGAGGTCTARPTLCPDVVMPVCGCDGATYGNECEANSNGQDVAFAGECPVATDCRAGGCPPTQVCRECSSSGGGTVHVCLPAGLPGCG